MALARWLLYAHVTLVAALVAFTHWAMGYSAPAGEPGFRLFMERVLVLPGAWGVLILLALSTLLFPGLVTATVILARPRRINWLAVGMVVADWLLAVLQHFVLVEAMPVRY